MLLSEAPASAASGTTRKVVDLTKVSLRVFRNFTGYLLRRQFVFAPASRGRRLPVGPAREDGIEALPDRAKPFVTRCHLPMQAVA
jgi:hypothetical protein